MNRKFSTFLNFIASVSWTTNWIALLYYQLFIAQVRMGMHLVLVNILICHGENPFSFLFLSKESSIEWIEQTWTALCKTDLLIVFIQASLLFFLYLFGSLLQETCFFNLEWFEQHFMQHVIIFILLKFSLLSYDLNIVCMIRMQKVHTTFETGWRILKNFQFHLYRPSMCLPGYCNWRCYEKNEN